MARRWTDPLALNELFLTLPAAEGRALYERIQAAADAARIIYEDDAGVSQVVPILARPRVRRHARQDHHP